MRQPDLCDGCLQPIEDGEPYYGLDEYPHRSTDVDEDRDEWVDPAEDEGYGFVFHWTEDARCLWAFVAARTVAVDESEVSDG